MLFNWLVEQSPAVDNSHRSMCWWHGNCCPWFASCLLQRRHLVNSQRRRSGNDKNQYTVDSIPPRYCTLKQWEWNSRPIMQKDRSRKWKVSKSTSRATRINSIYPWVRLIGFWAHIVELWDKEETDECWEKSKTTKSSWWMLFSNSSWTPMEELNWKIEN